MIKPLIQWCSSWHKESKQINTMSSTNTGRLLENYSIASLLPYETFDPEINVFYNRTDIGFVLEAVPLIGASEETLTILNSLITDSLPSGAIMQCLLWASPHIQSSLEQWAAERSKQGEIFATLAKRRMDYLQQGTLTSLLPQEEYVLRDFRLFISVILPNNNGERTQEQLITLRDQLLNTFRTIHLHARVLDANALIAITRSLINSSHQESSNNRWNPYDSLALQMSDAETHLQVTADGITINNTAWDVRCFSVQDYPATWAQWGMGDLIGDTYRDSLRIPCPFLINMVIHTLDREKTQQKVTIKRMRAEQQAHSPMVKFLPKLHQTSSDWKLAQSRLSEGDSLVQCFFQVVLYTPPNKGNYSETVLKNLYQAKGFRLRKERFLQLQSWLASLPMTAGSDLLNDLQRFGRLKTITSSAAVNLLPLQGEWKGMQVPRMLLSGRRGQIAYWDNFSNETGNYNVAVVGKSGSGKSVFLQEIMTSMIGSGGRVWVIDIGRSFEKTCHILGGEFIEFTPSSNICINPFTFIANFEEALAMLKPLFAMMAKPSNKTTDHENALIEQALKHAWEAHNNDATVTHVAAWLNNQADGRAKDLGVMLFSYTKDGMYGRFFEGKCTLNMQNPLVVLELEELKSKKDLQEVVLLVLMYQVTEAMYRGNRSQPIACIIDEAWDMLSGEQSGEFVETGCRRARKYQGAFITGTQSINDYYKTAAAKAAFENSDWVCLLSQKPESIQELKERKRIVLDGHMERLLNSIKTIQGQYAEVMIYGAGGYFVSRLLLDPFSKVMYSSKGKDFAAVKQFQKQGQAIVDAIDEVSKSKL